MSVAQNRAANYVEKHKVYALLAQASEHLMRTQPADPIAALIKHFGKPASKRVGGYAAPARAPRVVLLGGPASGKTELSKRLCEVYGACYLSTGALLMNEVAHGSELGLKAKSFIDAGKLVPDSIPIELVRRAMETEECKTKGWVLDGFPRTAAQVEALNKLHIKPTALVTLSLPDNVAMERASNRRFDPEGEGRSYHLIDSPPESEATAKRLVIREEDKPERLQQRISASKEAAKSVSAAYGEVAKEFDASLSLDELSNTAQAWILACSKKART